MGVDPHGEHLETDMLAITYQQQPVALAGRDRFWLIEPVLSLPDGHPTKRLVLFMTAYARDIITGHLDGPFTSQRAELYARIALMPALQFTRLADRSDDNLADHFGAPVEQVALRRHDSDAARA